MKIGLISHEYPPFAGGGIGTYATAMARLLAERGHDVHVVTNLYSFGDDPAHRAEHTRETTAAGGTLHVHRVRGIADDWGPPPGATAREIRVHREWSPYLAYAERVAEKLAAVHAEHGLDIAEFPECAAEGYGVIHRRRLGLGFADLPTTVTLHSPIEEIYLYNHYARQNLGFQQRKALEDRTILEADGVNAPSQRLIDMVRTRLGVPDTDARRWDCVRLPLVFDELPPPAPRSTGGARSIMAVGRVEPRKGVIDLADAVGPLLEKHPDATLDLIGRDCDAGVAPGAMSDFLRSRLPHSCRDRLVLHGQIPRDELMRRFASATAVVFASRWDNYPVTCIEAMAAGACCVVSDGVGTAEVLTDDDNALVFGRGDVAALRDRLERVLRDGELAGRIGSAAAASARSIADPDAAVRSRLEHYERVIESARRTPAAPASRDMRTSVSIAWTPTGDAQTDESVRTSADSAGATLVPGVDLIDNTDAEYRLDVPAGDRLAPDAIKTLLAVMNDRPDAAWAAPWAEPASHGGPMYAGQDFTLPLDLLADLSPRTVLTRSSALASIDAADRALPRSFRVLDARLAFAEAGLAGLAVPAWLTTAGSRKSGREKPLDADRGALLLEQLVARHPRAFAEHGAALWVYRAANEPAPVARSGEASAGTAGVPTAEPGFRGIVWKAFKQTVKRRYPTLTARARRLIGRR